MKHSCSNEYASEDRGRKKVVPLHISTCWIKNKTKTNTQHIEWLPDTL